MIGRNAHIKRLSGLLQALVILLLLPTLVVSADGETQLGTTDLISRGVPNEPGRDYGLGSLGNSLYNSLSWNETGNPPSLRLAFASSAENLDGAQPDADRFCSEKDENQHEKPRACFDILVQTSNTPNNPLIPITLSSSYPDGDALFPTVSRDGRYLVFQSGAKYSDYDKSPGLETDIFLAILGDNPTSNPELFRVSGKQSDNADPDFHSGNVDCDPVIYGVNHTTPPNCRTHPTGTAKPNFAHPHPVADVTFIEPEGVYVVFESMAPLGEDSNGYVKDIFIRQVTDGGEIFNQGFLHTLLSRGCGGQPANGDSFHPVFVPGTNGRYVVFVSRATNLDCNIEAEQYPADNPNSGLFYQRRANIFLLDRNTSNITLITKGTDDKPANRYAEYPAVAFEGGKLYIAFQSAATNLTNDSIQNTQIFLYEADLDASNGVLTNSSFQLISIRPDNSLPQGPSYHPSISGDGRIISFTSYDDQLVEGDLNNSCLVQGLEGWSSTNCPDIFGRNWDADQTWRASLTARGQPPAFNSNFSALSQTGRYVAFSSGADMLSEGEGVAFQQVYLRDQGNPPGNPNIQPSFHDFGIVPNNQTVEKEFNVYFFGLSGGSVTVTGVDISLNKCTDDSSRDCFKVVENICNGIKYDKQSCNFKVEYRAPATEQRLQRGKVKFSFTLDATNLFIEVGLRAATPFYYPEVVEPDARTVYYNDPPISRELIVKNSGNVADTLNLQILEKDKINLWITDLQGNPINQVGPLQPNEERVLLLWAESKDWGQTEEEYVETAKIKVTSAANSGKTAQTNVETTSILKRYQPFIENVAPSDIVQIDYNATSFFTFTVRNEGNISDSFSVSFANNEFSLWLDPADAPKLVNLPPGAEATVKVWVRATQPNHQDHDIRVIFTSQGDPSRKDERTVRVTSGPAYIYLPLVRK